VNHRIFERTLHPLVFRGVRLFECREFLHSAVFFWKALLELGFGGFLRGPLDPLPLNALVEALSVLPWCDKFIYASALRSPQGEALLLTVLYTDNLLFNLTSNQVGLPAELKHINKRRKRN
jgi:hypothetical protein